MSGGAAEINKIAKELEETISYLEKTKNDGYRKLKEFKVIVRDFLEAINYGWINIVIYDEHSKTVHKRGIGFEQKREIRSFMSEDDKRRLAKKIDNLLLKMKELTNNI